jgi:poly-beta-1,6-N-acetyl-D-glucosamine N-deacetylase
MSADGGTGRGNPAGAPNGNAAQRPPSPPGQHRTRWHRRLAGAVIAAVLVLTLASAGYAFVLKSIPYQTPQRPPPRVTLTAADTTSFLTYPGGLREMPVLAWRDVSLRVGHLVITPARFATQLAVLRRAGYHSVKLSTVRALAEGKKVSLPAHPVLLTFDDGLSTDWTTVDPILRRYGYTAVAFINPANVAIKSPSYFLTSDELRAMTASGRWELGLEMPEFSHSGMLSVREAIAAQGKLQAFSGSPVSAFAWPTLETGSLREQREPEALYDILHQLFPEVFGRPDGGVASFIVKGPAQGPLPRLNITAKDTLRSLSVRLRTGVQSPPPSDPLTLPWEGAGGTCAVSHNGVELTARRFALCTVLANGTKWRDYGLRLRVTAHAGVTAIIELRNSMTGCLEVAIGTGRVSVKQRVGHRWTVLGQASMPAQAAALGESPPPLLGSGALPVYVNVSSRLLTVKAGPVAIHHLVSPRVGGGVISLGIVSPGGRATASYKHLTIVRHP